MTSKPDLSPPAAGPPRRLGTAPTPEAQAAQAELLRLVDAAGAGDEEAMHRVVLHILPRVRNAVRYLRRGDDVDDLSQEVLVTVMRRLSSFRGEGRFEAWVDGVTLRVVIGGARKRQRDAQRLASIPPDEVTLMHEQKRYATSRQLVRALDQLPDDQREALVMHHVFGRTAPEIAEQLELPLETVRSRLRIGMGKLRALLRIRPEDRHG